MAKRAGAAWPSEKDKLQRLGSSILTDYTNGLQKRAANFAPLSPTSLVTRAAQAYPDAPAVVHGDDVTTWLDTLNRSRKIAGALRAGGAGPSTTVAALCRNIPEAVELTYAVPMSGAVLNMINSRLDAEAVAFILDHGEAVFFFVDAGLADVAQAALEQCLAKPKVIAIESDGPVGEIDGVLYEQFFADASPLGENELLPGDEWNALALNYTSGTTGDPKGVVTHHRGAYLAAIGNTLEWPMQQHPRYLWTLPLFHCNGWNFPWTIAAMAGVNVCLPSFTPATLIDTITDHDISHLCGAPIVVNMAVGELERRKATLETRVAVMTAGAAPPAAVLERAESVGFDLTHTYGLTEVYGPQTVCAWRREWDHLPADERAAKKARQGVRYAVLEELSVRDPETMEETPRDGETIGEVMFRGNVVMSGYLKNPTATDKAFDGGHFRSGDLAVRHGDWCASKKVAR